MQYLFAWIVHITPFIISYVLSALYLSVFFFQFFAQMNTPHFEDPSRSMWVFPKIVVPQIIHGLIGFSIINHPFWGTPIFGNTHVDLHDTFPCFSVWLSDSKKNQKRLGVRKTGFQPPRKNVRFLWATNNLFVIHQIHQRFFHTKYMLSLKLTLRLCKKNRAPKGISSLQASISRGVNTCCEF